MGVFRGTLDSTRTNLLFCWRARLLEAPSPKNLSSGSTSTGRHGSDRAANCGCPTRATSIQSSQIHRSSYPTRCMHRCSGNRPGSLGLWQHAPQNSPPLDMDRQHGLKVLGKPSYYQLPISTITPWNSFGPAPTGHHRLRHRPHCRHFEQQTRHYLAS
jgi:hypothetical protein